MGLRFRRSIRLFPGVRLNFSKRGVSATLGPRGASVNVGPRGTYANLGLPGTGLSYRTRLDGDTAARPHARDTLPPRTALPAEAGVYTADLAASARLEADVRRLVPVWPWLALAVGGLVVAGAIGDGAGFGLGVLAAAVGVLAALGVPRRRALVRARLLGLRPEGPQA